MGNETSRLKDTPASTCPGVPIHVDPRGYALTKIHGVPLKQKYLDMYPAYTRAMACEDVAFYSRYGVPRHHVTPFHKILRTREVGGMRVGGGILGKLFGAQDPREYVFKRVYKLTPAELREVKNQGHFTQNMAIREIKHQYNRKRNPSLPPFLYPVSRSLRFTNEKHQITYKPGTKGYSAGYRYKAEAPNFEIPAPANVDPLRHLRDPRHAARSLNFSSPAFYPEYKAPSAPAHTPSSHTRATPEVPSAPTASYSYSHTPVLGIPHTYSHTPVLGTPHPSSSGTSSRSRSHPFHFSRNALREMSTVTTHPGLHSASASAANSGSSGSHRSSPFNVPRVNYARGFSAAAGGTTGTSLSRLSSTTSTGATSAAAGGSSTTGGATGGSSRSRRSRRSRASRRSRSSRSSRSSGSSMSDSGSSS